MTYEVSSCPLAGVEEGVVAELWSLACNSTNVSPNNYTSYVPPEANLTGYFPAEWEESALRDFAYVIWILDQYFVPTLIFIGLIGNSISFFVFVRYLQRLSPGIYLAALALVDTGFLLLLFVSWANNIGFHLYNKAGWCQLFTYLTYVCGFLSVAFIVSFSTERYVAVCMPLQRRKVCTRRKARIVVICLVIYACVLYNFAIWTSSVQQTAYGTYCLPQDKYYRLVAYINNVDSILTLVIPSIVIVVTNSRIILTMMRLSARRSRPPEGRAVHRGSRFSSRSRSDSSNDLYQQDVPRSHARRTHFAQIRMTKMLITVSSMFVLLNMPSHAMRIYAFVRFMMDNSYAPSKLSFLIQRLSLDFYYINFSINFFLYSICGKNFRLALRHACRRMRSWLRRCCRLPLPGNYGSDRVPNVYELDTPLATTPQVSRSQNNNGTEGSVQYRTINSKLPNNASSEIDEL